MLTTKTLRRLCGIVPIERRNRRRSRLNAKAGESQTLEIRQMLTSLQAELVADLIPGVSAVATGLSVDAETAAGLGEIVASTTTHYSQVPLTNDNAFGEAIGKIKSVVFHQFRDLLESVGDGAASIAAAQTALTGANLNAAIEQGVVHQITPAMLVPYDARLLEGDSETTLEFNVELLGSPPDGASVNYTIHNETAIGEEDNLVAEGTFTWATDSEAVQAVSIPIAGDTIFQTDQVYVLHLMLPTDNERRTRLPVQDCSE